MTSPLGLTSSRWMTLCAIGRCSDRLGTEPGQTHAPGDAGVTIAELADEQLMSVQAISSMVATMEREGLIERVRRRGAGRTAFIRLTDRGRTALARVDELGERFMKPFLAGFTPTEAARLDADLRRLIENLSLFERELTSPRREVE